MLTKMKTYARFLNQRFQINFGLPSLKLKINVNTAIVMIIAIGSFEEFFDCIFMAQTYNCEYFRIFVFR